MQKSIGVWKEIFPPHMVASQLKILIPVGTAMAMVERTKKVFAVGLIPTVNMWWAHTLMLMKPMASGGGHHEPGSRRSPCARRPE